MYIDIEGIMEHVLYSNRTFKESDRASFKALTGALTSSQYRI